MASLLSVGVLLVLALAGPTLAFKGGYYYNYCYNDGSFNYATYICDCPSGFGGAYCQTNCNQNPTAPGCLCHQCHFNGYPIHVAAFGYAPHPSFCNKYYHCERTFVNGEVGYKATERCCAPGTYWNDDFQTCDHKENVQCNNGEGTCPPDPTGPPDCVFNNGQNLRAHPYECHGFQQCDNGNVVDRCCYHGLVFNEDKQICDWPQNVIGAKEYCFNYHCSYRPLNPCPWAKVCFCFTGYCQRRTDYAQGALAEEQSPSSVSLVPAGAKFDGQNDFYMVPFFSNQWLTNGPEELLTIIVFTPHYGGRPIQGLFGNGICGEEYTLGCKIIGIYIKRLDCTVNDVTVITDFVIYNDYTYVAYLYYTQTSLRLKLIDYYNFEEYSVSHNDGPVRGNRSPLIFGHNGCAEEYPYYGGPYNGYIHYFWMYEGNHCATNY